MLACLDKKVCVVASDIKDNPINLIKVFSKNGYIDKVDDV